MKRTQEIIGLPIISIMNGMEVGKVKSIIINAVKGTVDYIVVDSGIQALGTRVIPTEQILGIGEYALTIENEEVIDDISKIPPAIDLLQKDIQVKNTKVLTKKGRLIGETGDIYVDEEDGCKITGLEFISDITQKRIRIIPRENVITYGKNLIVVTEEIEDSLLDKVTLMNASDKPIEAEKKNLVNSEFLMQTEPLLMAQDTVESEEIANNTALLNENDQEIEAEVLSEVFTAEHIEEDATIEEVTVNEVVIPEPISEPVASTEVSAADVFEQRQRRYLNGRKATKTILDNVGNVIISEEMTITDAVIDEAKSNGKLIELVMNNKA